MNRLEKKVAIITGGAGGIGSTVGRLFAHEGAKVLLVDLYESDLKRKVAEINKPNVSYAVADVSKTSDVKRYVQIANERYGGIDIFINNAGIGGKILPLTEYTVTDFNRLIEVNIKGVWLGLKYVMPTMNVRGGGSIIITSSVAGVKATMNMVAYVASKHAVIGIMRVAALEGAPYNIRVNAISPGAVDNCMMHILEQGMEPDQPQTIREGIENLTPLGRYATNEDVAKLTLFLASPESEYITGTVNIIDGGFTI